MLEQLLEYDTELFLFLNNLGSEPFDGFWRFLSEKYSSIPLYAVLLYLIFKEFQLKATLWILLLVALMITCTDQLANLFKYVIFQRPRPCRLELLQEQMRFVGDTCGRYGYFSAHAASTMALAVFTGLLLKSTYKWLPFLMLFWAASVAYSRIILGVHYPLDIITGMFFGALIGWGFVKLFAYLKIKYALST